MHTRIDITLDLYAGERAAAKAFVWRDKKIIANMDILDDAAVVASCIAHLKLARAIRTFRALSPEAEIVFTASDPARAYFEGEKRWLELATAVAAAKTEGL